MNKPTAILGLTVLFATVAVAFDWFRAIPADTKAGYVGTEKCIQCHAQQGTEWEGSHHDLAMDLATPDSVLGDFNEATLTHHGVTSRMFRKDDKYFVNTEGPDGVMADFEVKYVFGVDPLQQYMVELDPPLRNSPSNVAALTPISQSLTRDAVGRVQVLRISWDTHKKKWFYLNPPDVAEKLQPDDPLHWTGSAQNWNHMCAECHSTNLKKNYDVASLSYHTTFAEIDVGCEACHGPGSIHTATAENKWLFWDRNHGYGLTRMKQAESKVQIESCAPCHSRRGPVTAGFTCGARFDDHYVAELLTPATYYPDGQILDEVYVYGSFLQSKMYHNGVRCTDCHHPHTSELKFDDNRVCTSCHQHDAAKYDTVAHHHHPGLAGSPGTNCVDCHMPATPYMDVDFRRDHSFKVPRPDLSLESGVPNACAGCHVEEDRIRGEKREQLAHYSDWLRESRQGNQVVTAELARVNRWAADLIREWYPQLPNEEPPVDFATILHQAWTDQLDDGKPLAELVRNKKVAGIVRASALMWLSRFPAEQGLSAARASLKDKNPRVRAAAVEFYGALPPAQRVVDIAPLLNDPIRNVRAQAALVLADASKSTLLDDQLKSFAQSIDEYRATMKSNGDQASAQMAVAILEERLGNQSAAEDAYKDAIRVQPLVTGPRSNLAAILDRNGRVEEAARLRKAELPLMERDARLAPSDAAIHYRLGLAYYLNGELEKAEVALKRSTTLQPTNTTFALPLALLYQKLENWDRALEVVERMITVQPENPTFRQVKAEILQAAAQASGGR